MVLIIFSPTVHSKWTAEAVKEKKDRCGNMEVMPKYEFYMYHPFHQVFKKKNTHVQ